MTTYEDIKKELNDAKKEHEGAKKKLEEWEVKLNELEEKLDNKEWGDDVEQKERWEGRIKRLIEEKEKLEATKERWEKQTINLQNKLAEFGGGEGNEQIA